MKQKIFILSFLLGCWFFSLTFEHHLNLAEMEKRDVRVIKNQIVSLNFSTDKNIFMNVEESSIYDMEEVAFKNQNLTSNLTRTKTMRGQYSMFVEGFQSIRTSPASPNLNCFDRIENRIVKPLVMLQAHLTCMKETGKLPRQIVKKDKTITFDKNYSGLFKKNYQAFGYNLYLEQNLSENSSKNKIKQGKQKLFKKYEEESKQYLRKNLFENPYSIKSEKCQYLDTKDYVTLYYDPFTDLFAIVESKKNCLLDFGIATEVKYAEIFAYKSFDSVKLEDYSLTPQDSKSVKSKELEVYQEPYILEYDDALAILEYRYGSNFIAVENGEFKIQDWQALKKLEHAICFGIQPEDYGFSQDQAKEINAPGGIIAYVRKGKKLPSLDLIRAYQNAIKSFCETKNQSIKRNDESFFRGEPSITFFNKETRQVVIFNRETKIFRTAYKLADRNVEIYLETGNIGSN